MNKTENYNLSLPSGSDVIDVNVLTENFKIIDRALASLKFFLKADCVIVTVGHSTDVANTSAQITDALPSNIHDRLCLEASISIHTEININGENFITVNADNEQILLYAFKSVSEISSSFAGRMCPIWLVVNTLDKSYTIVGDVDIAPDNTHSDGSTIYIYLGYAEFDWIARQIENEYWEFEDSHNTQVTIKFSDLEEVDNG